MEHEDDRTPDLPEAVAATVQRLEQVALLPLEQRPTEFQAIHDSLRDTLAGIDNA